MATGIRTLKTTECTLAPPCPNCDEPFHHPWSSLQSTPEAEVHCPLCDTPLLLTAHRVYRLHIYEEYEIPDHVHEGDLL